MPLSPRTRHSGWKLRYAPNLGLTSPDAPLFLHSAKSADPVDQIRYVASLGLAGIEDNSLKLRTTAVQERMGAELERQGLEMGCFVNNPLTWNQPMWGRSDDASRAQLEKDLRASIETAQRVNGRHLTVVGGRERKAPLAPQLANMVENLKRLAELAEHAGVTMVVETVDEQRWPGMLLHHIPDALAVVKAVASPAVKLVFDIGHIHPMDGAVIANLGKCWESIAVIQAADVPGRLELGSGALDWVEILRIIRKRGYTGLIELEHLLSRPGIEGERLMLERLRAIDSAI